MYNEEEQTGSVATMVQGKSIITSSINSYNDFWLKEKNNIIEQRLSKFLSDEWSDTTKQTATDIIVEIKSFDNRIDEIRENLENYMKCAEQALFAIQKENLRLRMIQQAEPHGDVSDAMMNLLEYFQHITMDFVFLCKLGADYIYLRQQYLYDTLSLSDNRNNKEKASDYLKGVLEDLKNAGTEEAQERIFSWIEEVFPEVKRLQQLQKVTEVIFRKTTTEEYVPVAGSTEELNKVVDFLKTHKLVFSVMERSFREIIDDTEKFTKKLNENRQLKV